jgi:hypothetical protein
MYWCDTWSHSLREEDTLSVKMCICDVARKIDIYCRNIFNCVCNADRRVAGSAVIRRPHKGEAQSSDLEYVEYLLEL